MKKTILYAALIALCSVALASCSDYLDITPKGRKVPKTVSDFRAFMENPGVYTLGSNHKRFLTNEFYVAPSSYAKSPARNNYLWVEEAGARIDNTATDNCYTYNYNGIFYCNLIIGEVPEMSDYSNGGKELVAQARVRRAMHYFHLVNTYAKAYTPATAATDPGVPFIDKAMDYEMGDLPQLAVARIYDEMIADLTEAIPDLPETALSVMLPNKAAGYGLRARIHLFMHQFEKALDDATQSLALNGYIFDMAGYYKTYVDPDNTGRTIQNDKNAFSSLPRITYGLGEEQHLFAIPGLQRINTAISTTTYQFPVTNPANAQNYVRDASRFEAGDARFLCTYFKNTGITPNLYHSQRSDYTNEGGIRTTEVLLIRAECYARRGTTQDIALAIKDLDALREKRIVKPTYAPTPGNKTKAEIIDLIRRERDVELMGTDMMFYDLKRFNTETEYKRTLKRDEASGTCILTPESDLWIFPFPANAMVNNQSLRHNTTI